MKIKPLNDISLIEEVSNLGYGEKYLVGGCVRDWILGKKCFDLDFLFKYYPLPVAQKLAQKYNARLDKFEKFLTLRLFLNSRRLDFAAFRKEKYPNCASLPLVSKASSLKEDLKRRDFTINAMAISLNRADAFDLKDPLNGLKDLKSGILRVIHLNSFRDDPTRIFRAARFCSRFSLKLEEKTSIALRKAVKNKYIKQLSKERIRNELFKILGEESPYKILLLLQEWEVLNQVYPFCSLRKEMDSLENLEERLIFLSACFPSPFNFISELNLPGDMKKRVTSEANPFEKKAAPEYEPSKLQKKIYKILYKRELKKRFIDFSDIKKMEIEYFMAGDLLAKIGRMQWLGKIKNRRSALSFLSTEYKNLKKGRRI